MQKAFVSVVLCLAISGSAFALEKPVVQEAKKGDAAVKMVAGPRMGFKEHQAAILNVLEREEKAIGALKKCVAGAQDDAVMEQCLRDHIKALQPQAGGM